MTPSPVTDEASANPRRPLIVRIGKKLRPWFNGVIARSSLVPNDPVLDPALFDWTATLTSAWPVIRAEAEGVLRHRDAVPPLHAISPDQARIAGDGQWKSFFLYGFGYRAEGNCQRAPRTAAALQAVPGLNAAFFSILAPGARIPRHKGVSKGLLTFHLGLIVPDAAEQCRMQVEDRTVHWGEGQCLVFDDSQHHEVWNDTDQTRVILLVQFARPARLPGKILSNLFLGAVRRTAFVQEALRNLDAWEDAYRRAEQA
uniref:Aspartyl/Asparaginyl beta-hydroxylase n=1 Tax=Caulobacter sp. (strain K31) TaxID=366602 RepID=B0T930_CAUSK